jgi:serine/threonine-protein kinase HipA
LAGQFKWDGGQGRFLYDPAYLQDKRAIPLDPVSLPLKKSRLIEVHQKGIFGVFSDSSADAWGKRVLESIYGALDDFEVLQRSLNDGVGAIAIGDLSEKDSPVFGLSDLQDAAKKIEAAQADDVPADILSLLRPTTSLGGAKPKINIEHEGEMWIAKFIERGDSIYLPHAELALLQLGKKCGLTTCDTQVVRIGKDCYAILVKRFDRERVANGFSRMGFASAHTVLRIQPESGLNEKSYIKLAYELQRWSSPKESTEQRRELWRRIVFNALVGNVDDHSKNHGFLQYGKSWKLSPAFDIVPSLFPRKDKIVLAMSFAKVDGRMTAIVSAESLLANCMQFGYQQDEAKAQLTEMASIVASDWHKYMVDSGMPISEADRFTNSFAFAGNVFSA